MATGRRTSWGGVALIVTLGLGSTVAADPGAARLPDNPYALASLQAPEQIAEAVASPHRAESEPEAADREAAEVEDATPEEAASSPDAADRERTSRRVRDAASPPDMEALAAEAAAQPAPPSDDGAITALDAVLGDDTADPISGVSDAPAADDDEPGGPSREDVREAFASVAPALRACADGQRGRVVELRATFRSSGRVSVARVESRTSHFSPRERSCMARAARHARLPRFELDRFEVTFPVRL